MNKKSEVDSVKRKKGLRLTRLSAKLNTKVMAMLGIVVVFVVAGTVGALNGWFGGAPKEN